MSYSSLFNSLSTSTHVFLQIQIFREIADVSPNVWRNETEQFSYTFRNVLSENLLVRFVESEATSFSKNVRDSATFAGTRERAESRERQMTS